MKAVQLRLKIIVLKIAPKEKLLEVKFNSDLKITSPLFVKLQEYHITWT